jgi:hypothetical protein
MFRFRKPEIENFRADFAKHADFYDIFEKDMKRLYLLAFLLTAGHKQAEHCFASTNGRLEWRRNIPIYK